MSEYVYTRSTILFNTTSYSLDVPVEESRVEARQKDSNQLSTLIFKRSQRLLRPSVIFLTKIRNFRMHDVSYEFYAGYSSSYTDLWQMRLQIGFVALAGRNRATLEEHSKRFHKSVGGLIIINEILSNVICI